MICEQYQIIHCKEKYVQCCIRMQTLNPEIQLISVLLSRTSNLYQRNQCDFKKLKTVLIVKIYVVCYLEKKLLSVPSVLLSLLYF